LPSCPPKNKKAKRRKKGWTDFTEKDKKERFSLRMDMDKSDKGGER
jgi:hypothetical protein